MNLVQQLKNAYEAIIKNNKLLDKEAKVAMTSRVIQINNYCNIIVVHYNNFIIT